MGDITPTKIIVNTSNYPILPKRQSIPIRTPIPESGGLPIPQEILDLILFCISKAFMVYLNRLKGLQPYPCKLWSFLTYIL